MLEQMGQIIRTGIAILALSVFLGVLGNQFVSRQSPSPVIEKESNISLFLREESASRFIDPKPIGPHPHSDYVDDHIVKALHNYFPNSTVQNLKVPFRPIRSSELEVLHSWKNVANEVREGGHPWCSLYRDNWSCVGEAYKEVLRNTPLFDHKFNLNAFPHGTNIYVEGNSHMGELISTIICNTVGVESAMMLGGWNGNSLYVKSLQNNAAILLICNHARLQTNPEKSLGLLKKVNFSPNYIIRGSVNEIHCKGQTCPTGLGQAHHDIYMAEFPNALYLPFEGRRLPKNCNADFQNCIVGGGHTCLPGPINEYAEDLAKILLQTSDVPN